MKKPIQTAMPVLSKHEKQLTDNAVDIHPTAFKLLVKDSCIFLDRVTLDTLGIDDKEYCHAEVYYLHHSWKPGSKDITFFVYLPEMHNLFIAPSLGDLEWLLSAIRAWFKLEQYQYREYEAEEKLEIAKREADKLKEKLAAIPA